MNKKIIKELNNLLFDFIPEHYKITEITPERNKSGVYGFRFKVYLYNRKFYLKCSLTKTTLFLGSIPEIRMLSRDYCKIKEVFNKMTYEYVKGE